MRGIPDKIATREDVYNIAMDLPVDKAKIFLDDLTPEKVRGLMTAEDIMLLKANVGHARWQSQAFIDRQRWLRNELKQAVAERETSWQQYEKALYVARRSGETKAQAEAKIKEVSNVLEALGELDDAIKSETEKAKKHTSAICLAQAIIDRRQWLRNELKQAVAERKTSWRQYEKALYVARMSGETKAQAEAKIKEVSNMLEALGMLDAAIKTEMLSALEDLNG